MQIETQSLNVNSPDASTQMTPDAQALAAFCQKQADQLAQRPNTWVRIVYHDPLLKRHQAVSSDRASLSYDAIAYLQSDIWLSDFPLVLTLTRFSLEPMAAHAYVCPIGYKNQTPEYIVIVTPDLLPPVVQQSIVDAAELLIDHLALYTKHSQQAAEVQILEHIIHRVGHQLRNPLGLIALNAENLRLGLTDRPLQEQAITISETVQHLLKNLTELIYCGKSSYLKTALCDLRQLIEESIYGMQSLLRQKQIEVICPDTSVTLKVDRIQMKQVFDNLLSNAIQFSPRASVICCDWRVFQGEVLIQISDQGTGLSADDLQKIFHPFYSRRPGGTGLGLAIAKKIVLDHQGSIWAQNLPDAGARFSISLPRGGAR